MFRNKLEAGIKSFAGLTPKREANQREKYARIYQKKGCEGLDRQSFWETGREMGGATAGFFGILGISLFIDAFEHGNLVGAITGLVWMAPAPILARLMFRAEDNLRILGEQPTY
jgi:hypothetical protein